MKINLEDFVGKVITYGEEETEVFGPCLVVEATRNRSCPYTMHLKLLYSNGTIEELTLSPDEIEVLE